MATISKTAVKKEDIIYSWSRIVFMWAGIVGVVSVAYAARSWSSSIAPSRTIMASAEGTAIVKPDIAIVSFSVISEGKNATTIQDDNMRKMNEAVALVKTLGVDPKDIQTSSYDLSPKYRYEQKSGISSIEGYRITQTVTVKVRNLDNAAKIVGGLPGVGVNQISGPSFGVEDVDLYLASARAEAFAKARAKAEALAKAAGVSIGKVVTFSESFGGGYPPVPMYAKAMGMGGDAAMPEFQPGSEEARVSVSVTFEIR